MKQEELEHSILHLLTICGDCVASREPCFVLAKFWARPEGPPIKDLFQDKTLGCHHYNKTAGVCKNLFEVINKYRITDNRHWLVGFEPVIVIGITGVIRRALGTLQKCSRNGQPAAGLIAADKIRRVAVLG